MKLQHFSLLLSLLLSFRCVFGDCDVREIRQFVPANCGSQLLPGESCPVACGRDLQDPFVCLDSVGCSAKCLARGKWNTNCACNPNTLQKKIKGTSLTNFGEPCTAGNVCVGVGCGDNLEAVRAITCDAKAGFQGTCGCKPLNGSMYENSFDEKLLCNGYEIGDICPVGEICEKGTRTVNNYKLYDKVVCTPRGWAFEKTGQRVPTETGSEEKVKLCTDLCDGVKCKTECRPNERCVAGVCASGGPFAPEDSSCKGKGICTSAGSCVCVPGTFSTSSECKDCPPGRFSEDFDSQWCENCEPGRFNPSSGASVCMECEEGISDSGDTSCRPECNLDSECDNGLYCDGEETCVNLRCHPGEPRCGEDQLSKVEEECRSVTCQCFENPNGEPTIVTIAKTCVFTPSECNVNAECSTDPGSDDCLVGPFASPGTTCGVQQVCNDSGDCVKCILDADCDDNIFCNGIETCPDFTCAPGMPEEDGVPCNSPSSDTCQGGSCVACFGASMPVTVRTGNTTLTVAVSEVKIGDEVLSLSEDGSMTFSPVYIRRHYDSPEADIIHTNFLDLKFPGGHVVLSDNHLIYVTTPNNFNEDCILMNGEHQACPLQAGLVRVGDTVWVTDETSEHFELVSRSIESVSLSTDKARTFLTLNGNVLVNGVAVSSHVYHHKYEQIVHIPMRIIYRYFPQYVDSKFVLDIWFWSMFYDLRGVLKNMRVWEWRYGVYTPVLMHFCAICGCFWLFWCVVRIWKTCAGKYFPPMKTKSE